MLWSLLPLEVLGMIFLLCPSGFNIGSFPLPSNSHRGCISATHYQWHKVQVRIATGTFSLTANTCPKSFPKSRAFQCCVVEDRACGYELEVWGNNVAVLCGANLSNLLDLVLEVVPCHLCGMWFSAQKPPDSRNRVCSSVARGTKNL